jgi:hypothetical protein
MRGNKFKVIISLLLGMVAAIFGNYLAISAPVANDYVLGQECSTLYRSAAISSDAAGTSEVFGICFPAINDDKTYIWSLDTNVVPKFKIVIDTESNPDTKTAFGRTCPSKEECVLPVIRDEKFLENEPFVKYYPDVKFEMKDRGRWWSKSYEENIIKGIFQKTNTETTEPEPNSWNVKLNEDTASAAFLVGLTTFVSLSSSASIPINQNQQGAPELLELKGRKERRFSAQKGYKNFFESDLISLDRWSFFTIKLPKFIRQIGRFSSPAATSIGDGDYLRAALGVFSFAIYPAAIAVGVAQYYVNSDEYLIPDWKWLTVAIILGCIDSLAGAIAASIFILIVAANDLIDKDMGIGAYEYLSALIIIFTLSAGPGLFAGALRRFDGVHTNRTGKWERMIDYALSPLITSWVVWKVLEATVKFSNEGKSAIWEKNIETTAILVYLLIFSRYFIEALVAKHLPDRINEIVAESVQIQRFPKIFQSVRKSAVIFIFLSGVAIQAKPWLVASLFLIPAISLLLGIKPGNKFSKLNLIGVPRLVLLMSIGLVFTQIFKNPPPTTSPWLVVGIAALPILYLNLAEALSESHLKAPAFFYLTKIGKVLYRLGAILLFAFMLYVIYKSNFLR